jgi:predicted  nucleic acid-binding Zn-ribbon protein
VSALETLLALQARDLSLDRLHHRHATLAERETVARLVAEAAALTTRHDALTVERDALASEETRLDDEARKLEGKAKDVEAKMYSGEISSPRELQAMQADVTQLRRHQRDVENRELEVMEQREPLDESLAALAAERVLLDAQLDEQRASLAAAEQRLEAEMAVEHEARTSLVDELDSALVAAYEERRAKATGVGAARLVGATCQGCHLTIPATEVEQIRKAPEGSIAYCDNCGCILVL